MRAPSDISALHQRFRTVGSALMRANLNNTHSGNMSCRDPRNAGRFWITASGSACGHLSPADIVAVRFEDLGSEGPARPSSEANTHRRVLELPGANACVHCHAVASTLLGFESPRNPIFLLAPDPPRSDSEEYLFQPVDVWGAGLIGAVTVGVYQDTVGSLEMEQRIPAHLGRAPVAIVKAHGPFARGQSLEECLHYVGVLECSATVAIALRRRGVDTLALQRALRAATPAAVFAWPPRPLDGPARAPEPAADPASRCEFNAWLSYNFDLGLGAFGTGSMSRKRSADEMLFCPMSAAPPGIEADLRRIPLRPQEPEAADVRLHRLIYTRTPYTACMVAASPLATAEAMAALAAVAGVEALAGHPGAIARSAAECPIVAPIDAESTYHQIRLPVTSLQALALDAEGDLVSSLLQSGKGACLVAGGGVIAAGERSLAQAAYRVALAERVARFRQEVDLHHRMLGAPPAAAFE